MTTTLDAQLQALHRQLAELDTVPASTREQLLILSADIARLVDADTVDDSPAEALEAMAARFDVDHPALSSGLRNLIDSLSKAGI